MDADAWTERWRTGRIGFHEGRPNTYLERHVDRLSGRVLVPLCGKAEDLAFLAARGHEVVGIELVEAAVRAFFDDHGVIPTITRRDPVTVYTAGPITILAGDVFATTRELLAAIASPGFNAELRGGVIDSVYDRAALIALPAELRPRYVAHLRAIAPVFSLVVTLEYPQDQMTGPPFAVLEDELRELYRGARVELLGEGAEPPRGQAGPGARVRPAGLMPLERCWAITP